MRAGVDVEGVKEVEMGGFEVGKDDNRFHVTG